MNMRLLSPLRGLATLGLSGTVAALVGTSALGQALERVGEPVAGNNEPSTNETFVN